MTFIRVILFLVVLLASRGAQAQAGPPSRQQLEEYERAGDYLACAEAYEQAAKGASAQRPEHDLYNAGICFEEAKLVSRAIATYQQLIKRFPRSALSQKAHVRVASACASIASFSEAAHWYEMYAKRYPGEKDAPDALSSAVLYRKALGDTKAAVADVELFVKYYKKKLKEESVAALFALPSMHERAGDGAAARKAYRRYIVEVGKSGGLDRLLIANARAGEIAWKKSCVGPTPDGSCLIVKRARPHGSRVARADRCGPESTPDIEPLARDAVAVAEARAFFATAVALGASGAVEKADDAGRRASALYWLTASRFYLAEEEFETFFGLELPGNLDFSDVDSKQQTASKKRLATFKAETSAKMGVMLVEYQQIREVTGAGGHWAIASAARVGQLSQQFADTLLTAKLPASIPAGSAGKTATDAYCGTITTAAEPLEELAVGAFGFCLELSQNLNSFGQWSKRCAASLYALSPEQFPRATESYDVSPQSGDMIDRVGLILEE